MLFNLSSLEGMIGNHHSDSKWLRTLALLMAFGLFVMISGKVWIESSSARVAQVNVWLLLPALLCFFFFIIKARCLPLGKYYVPWLAFLFWVGLSTLWSDLDRSAALNIAKRGVLIFVFLYAIQFLLVCHEVYLRKAIFLGVIVVALGALAILLYQIVWLSPTIKYRAFRLDRLGVGDFVNYRYPLAAGLFHGAIATWAFSAVLDRNNGPLKAAFWFFVFVILVVMVFFTYARGAWLGVAFAAFLSIILNNSRRGWFLLGLGVIVVIGFLVVWWDHLMTEIFNRKLSGRGPIWDYFFSVMPDHWLVGFGLGTPFEYHWADGKTVSPHAHSLFFQQIYDSGIISVMLLLIGLITLTYRAWAFRSVDWVRFALPALGFAVTVMLTDVERIFTRPNDYWTIFWMPVAILLAMTISRKSKEV